MLSRSFLRPSRINKCPHTPRPNIQSGSIRRFTAIPQWRAQQPTSTPETSEPRQKQNEGPKNSIRPFTVLFWCIPIGYGVNWALKQQSDGGQVGRDGFVKYVLATKEPVSSTCAIFTLVPSSPNAINADSTERARSITSVQIKQPQLQIARSYTLLPPTEGQDEDELRFLIKQEQKGEVSGYLHRLPLDAEVEARGIGKEYVISHGVEKVVFLAGGTGIAPALQVADVLNGEKADLHILWANRKREDCAGGKSDTQYTVSTTSWWDFSGLWKPSSTPKEEHANDASHPPQRKHQIVRELDEAKTSNSSSDLKLRIDYFVDEENTFIQPRDVNRLLQDSTGRKKLLIVSGPEGFINYWAGPKEWLNGREVQGPLAGALGSMDMTGWDVVKL